MMRTPRMLLLEGLDQFRAVRVAARLARDHENDRRPFGRGGLGGAHDETKASRLRSACAFCFAICSVICMAISRATAACAPPTRGAWLRARALGEGGQLELQRLVLLHLDLLLGDLRIDLAIDLAALVEVIEREIGVVLEDADLAHLLEADAAGRDVGHAAVFETDARVGDVLALAQHGGADRIDRLDRRAHEMQHDFEIVDHQIEHDADVGAASGIGGEPVRLDEAGRVSFSSSALSAGIEALDVADLQDELLGVGEIDQRLGLLGVVGDRLFDQDVLAQAEKERADFVMRAGRRGDGGGIDLLGQRLRGGEGLHAVALRDLLGHMAVEIVKADELDAGQLRINARMFAPDMSDPDHTDS